MAHGFTAFSLAPVAGLSQVKYYLLKNKIKGLAVIKGFYKEGLSVVQYGVSIYVVSFVWFVGVVVFKM